MESNYTDEQMVCECRTCKECDGVGEWIAYDLIDGGSWKSRCSRCQGSGLDKNGCEIHGAEIEPESDEQRLSYLEHLQKQYREQGSIVCPF